MANKKRYDPELVEVKLEGKKKATWSTAGGVAVKGVEHRYSVKDRNFDRLNEWLFAVRVPEAPRGDIVVQPIHSPAKNIWADIERRSIMLPRATKQHYRAYAYCKVHLSDPSGEKNWVGTTVGDRNLLPQWLQVFRRRMRLKRTVVAVRGYDGRDQVILALANNHQLMIKLFFAQKVWVLQEGFEMPPRYG